MNGNEKVVLFSLQGLMCDTVNFILTSAAVVPPPLKLHIAAGDIVLPCEFMSFHLRCFFIYIFILENRTPRKLKGFVSLCRIDSKGMEMKLFYNMRRKRIPVIRET